MCADATTQNFVDYFKSYKRVLCDTSYLILCIRDLYIGATKWRAPSAEPTSAAAETSRSSCRTSTHQAVWPSFTLCFNQTVPLPPHLELHLCIDIIILLLKTTCLVKVVVNRQVGSASLSLLNNVHCLRSLCLWTSWHNLSTQVCRRPAAWKTSTQLQICRSET